MDKETKEFLLEQFGKINDRLSEMDDRFDRMDDRFDKMDDRFDRMDEKLNNMQSQLNSLEKRVLELTDMQKLTHIDVEFLKGKTQENEYDINRINKLLKF